MQQIKMKHNTFGTFLFEFDETNNSHRFKLENGEWHWWAQLQGINSFEEFKNWKLGNGWEIVDD